MNDKIFCIGYNKTGTTSLYAFFDSNEIPASPQVQFQANLCSYLAGNYSTFKYIIDNIYPEYRFYQDYPFSLPNFYKYIDVEYPNSKFILSVRQSSEDWYNSWLRYNQMLDSGKVHHNRKNIELIFTEVYGTPKNDVFNKERAIRSYENHIKDAVKYFGGTNKLLKLYIGANDSVKQLEEFIGFKSKHKKMLIRNKSI